MQRDRTFPFSYSFDASPSHASASSSSAVDSPWRAAEAAPSHSSSGGGGEWSWWGEETQQQDSNRSTDASDEKIEAGGESEKENSSSSSSSSSFPGLPPAGWQLQLHPSLKTKFKSPALVKKTESSGGGSVSAAEAAGVPSPAAATAATAAPSLLSQFRIRFVKSKEVLNAEAVQQESNQVGAAAASASVAASSTSAASVLAPRSSGVLRGNKSVQAGVPSSSSSSSLLLPRSAAPVAARARLGIKPLHARPSLLTPVKKPPAAAAVSTAAATAAASTATSPAAATTPLKPAPASTSSLSLTHVFHATYCLADRKKKQYREGFLHPFQSTLSSAAADTSTPSSSSSPSFLKSQLYTERGVLVDEQLGKSVMEYEDPSLSQQRQKRQRRQEEDEPFIGGKRKRRKGESEEDEEEEQEDSSASAIAPSAPSSSTSPSYLTNLFQVGEVVVLGRFECELEEEISFHEYERHRKIMTGELSNAPLSRFSTANSVSITGPPLSSDNIGFRLLSKQGLESNGGVLGRSPASGALKEPLALVWRRQDSRPGIGFVEKPRIVPPTRGGHSGGGRGGRR